MTVITTLNVLEMAAEKKCSRQTIEKHRNDFTWISVPGYKHKKILWDEKAQAWKPNLVMQKAGKQKGKKTANDKG